MASTFALIAEPALGEPASSGGEARQVLRVDTGLSVEHDDNLFRLPSAADTQAALGRSTRGDTISVTRVGLTLDKRVSLQRLELEAVLEDRHYATFDYLDFTALNYRAAWHWSLTPALHGSLSDERKQSLNSFVDYTGYRTRNVRTDQTRRLDGLLDLSGAWHLLGGAAQTTRTNSEAFNQEGDNRITSLEAGVRRDLRSGTTLALTLRQGRGDYVNRHEPEATSQLDNRFEQRERELSLHWPIGGKTDVDVRAARLERTHEHFAARDYAGNVGAVSINWRPTEKTTLQTEWRRELSSYQSSSSSYIVADRLAVSPSWQITAKTRLSGRYAYARRDYRGPLPGNPASGRADTERSASLALEWQARPGIALSASLQNDRRTSSQENLDFDSTQAGIAARVAF